MSVKVLFSFLLNGSEIFVKQNYSNDSFIKMPTFCTLNMLTILGFSAQVRAKYHIGSVCMCVYTHTHKERDRERG